MSSTGREVSQLKKRDGLGMGNGKRRGRERERSQRAWPSEVSEAIVSPPVGQKGLNFFLSFFFIGV